MVQRAPSDGTLWRRAGRAAALVVLLGLVSGRSSADPTLTGSEVAREVTLLKAPPEDVRFRWSATVHEAGGEFILSRQGWSGVDSVVARVPARGDGRYDVAEHGGAGSWVYSLRYRDRHGRDHTLVMVWLNVERLDTGRGLVTDDADAQPAAVQTAAVLDVPEIGSGWPGAGESAVAAPARWPPAPPP